MHPLSHIDDSGRYEGAFAFKRPLALMELLKAPTSTWQKIVARCRDGNGFFVQPATSANMLRVFVTPWAIRNLVFL
jgi:hypothetical protein